MPTVYETIDKIKENVAIIQSITGGRETSSTQEAAILWHLIIVGEQIKFLKTDQPNLTSDLITQLKNVLEPEAKFFKQCRDAIMHSNIYYGCIEKQHLGIPKDFPQPPFKINIPEIVSKNLPSLILALDEVKQRSLDQECDYQPGRYQGDNKPIFKSADHLIFIKLEIKALIYVLKENNIPASFAGIEAASQNNLTFQAALKHHVSTLGQMVKDYRFYFINKNNYKQKNPYRDATIAKIDSNFY